MEVNNIKAVTKHIEVEKQIIQQKGESVDFTQYIPFFFFFFF